LAHIDNPFRQCFGKHFDFNELMSVQFNWANLKKERGSQRRDKDPDYQEKKKALDYWNSNSRIRWKDVAVSMGRTELDANAVKELIKRFAKDKLPIRKGKSGSPKLHE